MSDVEILSGTVSEVYDGDTFTLELRQGYSVKVRLIGIDTPELKGNQPLAIEARDKLRQLIYEQQIKVTTYGHDQYGRKLGSVSKRGENVSVILVSLGLAKVFRNNGAVYGSIQNALEQAEQLARNEGKGVWRQ